MICCVCRRTEATEFRGKAGYCESCVDVTKFVENQQNTSALLNAKRSVYKEKNQIFRNCPGGHHDSSQR